MRGKILHASTASDKSINHWYLFIFGDFKVGSISNSTATFFCTIFKVSSAIISPKRSIYADFKSSYMDFQSGYFVNCLLSMLYPCSNNTESRPYLSPHSAF